MAARRHDPWDQSLAYERFMGRWSRKISALFLDWLEAPGNLRWLDVGCGTGALSFQIAGTKQPAEVLGIDASAAFIKQAAGRAGNRVGLKFRSGSADRLGVETGYFDWAVSALALNFFPSPLAALQEMRRAVRPGGKIALFVWDYSQGMQMLRVFWDAATSLDPDAIELDEGMRFPICRPQALRRLFLETGLAEIKEKALNIETLFSSFDDYWEPFLGATGPAPGYLASLGRPKKKALENALRAALPVQPDGSIHLAARAWAVQGAI